MQNGFKPNTNKLQNSKSQNPRELKNRVKREMGFKDQHFICPVNPNHRLATGSKLVKHCMRCKEARHLKEFYRCGYNHNHIFSSSDERKKHHKICPQKGSGIFSPLLLKNDGYNPNKKPYQPSFHIQKYYHENKKRFKEEQQILKEGKKLLRVEAYNVENDPVEVYRKRKLYLNNSTKIFTTIIPSHPGSEEILIKLSVIPDIVTVQKLKTKRGIEIKGDIKEKSEYDFSQNFLTVKISESIFLKGGEVDENIRNILEGDSEQQLSYLVFSLCLFYQDQAGAKAYLKLLKELKEHEMMFIGSDRFSSKFLLALASETKLLEKKYIHKEYTDLILFILEDNKKADNFMKVKQFKQERKEEEEVVTLREKVKILKKEFRESDERESELKIQEENRDERIRELKLENRKISKKNEIKQKKSKEIQILLEMESIDECRAELKKVEEENLELRKKEQDVEYNPERVKELQEFKSCKDAKKKLRKIKEGNIELITLKKEIDFQLSSLEKKFNILNSKLIKFQHFFEKVEKEDAEKYKKLIFKYRKKMGIKTNSKRLSRKTVKRGRNLRVINDENFDIELNTDVWEGLSYHTIHLCELCKKFPKSLVFENCGHCSLCFICGMVYLERFGKLIKCFDCGEKNKRTFMLDHC